MTTVLPSVHQDMSTMPGLTQFGSVSQFGPSMPNAPSTWLISPLPASSSRNSVPTATAGVTLGR